MKIRTPPLVIFWISLLVLLLKVSPGFSQRKTDKGYIIRQDSTIVHGEFAVKLAHAYTDYILFRATGENEFVRLGPTALKGYFIASVGRFESIEQKASTRFYKYLVEGKINLLQLDEAAEDKFFYKYEGKPLNLLFYKVDLDNGRLHKVEAYKSQLKNEMAGCPGIEHEIDDIHAYAAKDLTKVFIAYNKCVGQTGETSTRILPKENIIFAGIALGKAFSKPGFYSSGLEFDFLSSKSKLGFLSAFYHYGFLDQNINFPNNPKLHIQHRMREFGVKFNAVLVSQKKIEPYIFGTIGHLKVRYDIESTEIRKQSYLSFAGGAGLKVNVGQRLVMKAELRQLFIPGSKILDQLTTYIIEPVRHTISYTPLTSLSLCMAYKIK